jgi:hypothetical protein
VRKELIWGFPPENLDAEVKLGELEDLGEGRVGCDVREVYRWKQTGEFAPNAGGGSCGRREKYCHNGA